MSTPLFEAEAVTFARGRREILRDVSLRIKEREIVAILGASGVGKSTLIQLFAGLLVPQSGRILLNGAPLRAGHGTAVVFQSPTLLPWLTVAENVAFGLDFACHGRKRSREAAARVEHALCQVGLADRSEAKTHTLSGGEAQRVALARALVRDPDLLLLDEPFAALDAITRTAMQELFVSLVRRRPLAACLVTHDLDEALRVADHIVVLGGSPARVTARWSLTGPHLQRPSHEALRAALAAGRGEMRDPSAAVS